MIEPNSVREAIHVLEGKIEPYEQTPPKPLRDLLQEEVESYAKWYIERKQPGYNQDESDETDDGEYAESDDPDISSWVPSYSTPTLNALGFDQEEHSHQSSAKVGRNDPCPCRSGKKYKKCCGK